MCGHVSVHIHLEHMYQYMSCSHIHMLRHVRVVCVTAGSHVCTHETHTHTHTHTHTELHRQTFVVSGRWRHFKCVCLSNVKCVMRKDECVGCLHGSKLTVDS